MIARLICFFLGHALDKLEEHGAVQSPVYVRSGKCARCGIPIMEVHSLRDDLYEDDPPKND